MTQGFRRAAAGARGVSRVGATVAAICLTLALAACGGGDEGGGGSGSGDNAPQADGGGNGAGGGAPSGVLVAAIPGISSMDWAPATSSGDEEKLLIMVADTLTQLNPETRQLEGAL